ncbi:MAG: carboxypeptidase-like regulatory domain-containing protein [Gemmatimonadota bacterium]|jgi:hypothetical protein|nr:carboxypeptidase-like regulatory domain-containing protein [Gemmatimonadota bacterium]
MRSRFFLFLLALLFWVVPTTASAQQVGEEASSLRVIVVDESTGMPVSGARVFLLDILRFWATDASGVVTAGDIPPGEHQFEVSGLGFYPQAAVIQLEPGGTVEAAVRLEPRPILLDALDVMAPGRARFSATLAKNGFYERARSGFGLQLDRIAIEEMNPGYTSDLFRRMPGVILDGREMGGYRLLSRRSQGSLGGSGECPLLVFVDGNLFQGELDELQVSWIEGAEVYLGLGSIPPRFQQMTAGNRQADCGVVLFWTA